MATVLGEGFAVPEPVHSGKGVSSYGAGDEDTLAQGGCHRTRLADEPGLGAIVRLWKEAVGKNREGGPSAWSLASTPFFTMVKCWKTVCYQRTSGLEGTWTGCVDTSVLQICLGYIIRG